MHDFISRSKLQRRSESESNFAAIFQLNSFPGEIFFLASDWDFFWWGGGGELGEKEDNLDWEWGLLSAPGDREKRP